MKGYILTICMPLVAAIWLWFRFQQPPQPPTTMTTSFDNKLVALKFEYPVLRFTTVGATGQGYSNFIETLRNHLTGDMRHDIRILRSTVDIRNRYVLVELTNRRGITVTLAVDIINVYVVGYLSGNNAIFLLPDNDGDREAITNVFTNANRQTLTNRGNYPDLERRGRARSVVNLGLYALDEAISTFEGYATGGHGTATLQELLCSFIVCLQMISEAARFNLIRQDIRVRIEENQERPPDPRILSLENNWGSLSEQIQRSIQGAFVGRVQLRQRNDQEFDVDSLTPALIRNMGVMLYYCADPQINNYESNQDVCKISEPTVRIAGPNGFCADVYGGSYDNGNKLILHPCKTNTEVNQLWTLKRDGTIRSNNKCLTTYGYSPGAYIMIYDCISVAVDATHWVVWDNGTIINPESGLVLSARTWEQGATLTVETNVYSTSQSWRPTNVTEPFVSSIVGLNDLCLQATAHPLHVWLQSCKISEIRQQWAIYTDGSIRPQEDKQYCLTGGKKEDMVKLHLCKPESSGQRWEFKNDGSIWNLNSRMVLDVKYSDPSIDQIIVWPYSGSINQKWILVY